MTSRSLPTITLPLKFSRRFDPHLIGDFRIVRRHEVRQDERLDAGGLCHASGVFR